MYYGLHEHNQIQTVQDALQQRADSQAGTALIEVLSPNISVYPADTPTGFMYSVEVALDGWWGSAEAETLEKALNTALWDAIEYLSSVNTQRFLNKHGSKYLRELHDETWELRESR